MQGLSLTPCLIQAPSITLGLQQTQALVASLSLTRTYGPGDPGTNLHTVLAEAIQQIKNQPLREAVSAFVAGNANLGPTLLQARSELALATKERTDKFAVNYVFRTSTDREGKFIHMRDEDGKELASPLATKIPHFCDAYFRSVEFEREVTNYRETLKSARQNVGSTIEYEEMADAVKAVAMIRPHIDAVCLVLSLLFSVKSDDRQQLLQSFLRNLVILENLDLVLSERLLKRFVHRFYKVAGRGVSRDYEEMILNTIAEFTLLSMGIISPNIFELQRIPRDTEQYGTAQASLKEVGVDLNKLMDRYSMQRGASFTWFNRYATKKVRSSGTTEEIIRTFITKTVRADRAHVLEIIEYPNLFEELKKLKCESEDRDEFAQMSTTRLAEVLSAPAFQEPFGKLLHGWYPKLECLL